MKRFHEYNLNQNFLKNGVKNSIADVPSVAVGHLTKIENEDVRTGVTVIDPGVANLFSEKIPAAISVGNGFGKLAGYTQVEELGTIETPIALTNTLAVGPVTRGIINLTLKKEVLKTETTINAVVGETNDGILNNIHESSISPEDVILAYENKKADFEIGCVGAGAGTRCFSWKGGIGTSSKIIPAETGTFTLGVLAQTNFGGSLVIHGVPIGRILNKNDFNLNQKIKNDGSCMIVIATDAPLSARQLKRLASRAFLGLARTGSIMANGSGDYAIAFSTSRNGLESWENQRSCLNDTVLTNFFLGCVEAVEESVYDALFAAENTTGRNGNVLSALPKEEVVSILQTYLPKI